MYKIRRRILNKFSNSLDKYYDSYNDYYENYKSYKIPHEMGYEVISVEYVYDAETDSERIQRQRDEKIDKILQ